MLRSKLTGLLALASCAWAKAIDISWDVTWVTAAPDGFSRPVVGINGQWPCPEVRASVGDTVNIHLTNKLGNQTTGLHFHGINQISTNWMDGPSMATQCPLPPDMTMSYSFTADAPGTYWYHSHNLGQYPDGLRGPLIIDDPNEPYKEDYDEEHILTISDWYQDDAIKLMKAFLNPANPQGIPPIPKSILLNEGKNKDYQFAKGKRYRFRIISFASFASAMIHFDSHDMHVIMNDAAYIKKEKVSQLRITPAQRFDVIIEATDQDHGNYPFLISLDLNRDWTKSNPPSWKLNSTGYLVMEAEGERKPDVVEVWTPHDDSHFEPLNGGILPQSNATFEFNFESCNDSFGIHRACVNGSPYVMPRVPTLYTAATTGEDNTNPIVYGNVHPFVVKYGDIVDIVVNNRDPGVHPFHLHGHHFQVLARPPSDTGDWPGVERTQLNQKPPMRDTVTVMAKSYAVLRFVANNPGVYLFHCHIEWHVEMGLSATIIEAPELLRDAKMPEDHKAACARGHIPISGNAAGNSDALNTTGMNTHVGKDYIGAQWIDPEAKTFRSRVVRRSISGRP